MDQWIKDGSKTCQYTNKREKNKNKKCCVPVSIRDPFARGVCRVRRQVRQGPREQQLVLGRDRSGPGSGSGSLVIKH
jgi:hypothetical protein